MVGKLILRGLIVGIVAGLLAFGFAKSFGEPLVNVSINFESAKDAAERAAMVAHGVNPGPEDEEIFSRAVQSGIGLFTGLVAVGMGIGGLFAVMFAFANGRMGSLSPGATSILLSFYGLISVYVVPALKYPANPPAVGEPETIKLRTGLYFLMMALSIAATIGALIVRRKLVPQFGSWTGAVMAFLVYLVIIFMIFTVLPNINEVPANFPAVTLWQFRVTSLGIQAILWGGIGVMFGYLAEKTART